ncbi:MAG TPA: cytochrome c oxidase subunit II [Thermoanaerobaculia bacterium]|nr:cytochrome c oxidase subunit II [Thermoanaerobaculia bacterium]
MTIVLMTGIQSALNPAGVQAEKIARLWDLFFWVSAVVYVLVMIFLLAALLRRRPEIVPNATSPRVRAAVSIATGLTVLTLFALLTASIFTGRSLSDVPERAIQIGVTGKQWWWHIEYDDTDKSKRITTANEITIPVGMPVTVHLQTSDVIHSFWVPNLHGKRDLIPGRRLTWTFSADRPGVYRGQCAEFCGYQHAKMALWINALPAAEYASWLEASRKSSKIPSTPEERKGQEVFMSSPCPLCHTIGGTEAAGKTGPDLTHFASRRSIGAASVPNRREFLAHWIVDAQHFKPGSLMPSMTLEPGQLEPLVVYLESLR